MESSCPNCTLPLDYNFIKIAEGFGFCNACQTILEIFDDAEAKIASFEKIVENSHILAENVILPEQTEIFRKLLEANAVVISKNWYKHGEFPQNGIYEGINLGELIEFNLYPEILQVMKNEFFE